MVSTSHQCLGVAGKVCHCFLPAENKDSITLCTSCFVKSCTSYDCCADCHDWTDEKWEKYSAYDVKLAIQWEKGEEGQVFSSSFSGFSSMAIPLLKMQSDSFDNTVTMTKSSIK